MYCGGQGIYAAYLAREWQRAGHEVHVIAGPPLPDLAPGIGLDTIPNANVFGLPLRDWAKQNDPRTLLTPVNLWELGVSRIGVFPEMQSFGLRLFLRWRELQARHRFDVVFDNQSLSLGAARPPGHRRARGVGDPSSAAPRPRGRLRRGSAAAQEGAPHALLPALHAAGRGEAAGADRDGERGLAPRDRALLRHPREGGAGGLQRHRHRALPPASRGREAGRPDLRRAHRGSEEGHRHAARGALAAAAPRHAEDRGRPHPGARPRADADAPLRPRGPRARSRTASSRRRSSCASTRRGGWRWCLRSSRASASRPARRWRAACPSWPTRRARCPR